MPKIISADDQKLPEIKLTSVSLLPEQPSVAVSSVTGVDTFDHSERPDAGIKGPEKRLPTIIEVDETLPEPGVEYITHGGETLRRIALEAYGDLSMLPALTAIYGCGADKLLPAGIEIKLPVPHRIDSEGFEDATLTDDEKSRAALTSDLAATTDSTSGALGEAIAALHSDNSRSIDNTTPLVLADTKPGEDPKIARTTLLGAEVDSELRGLKSTSNEISTQTDGDAEVHMERISTAVIGDPDRERTGITLHEEDRIPPVPAEKVDAFTPFKADDIEKLKLANIKNEAKLEVSTIESKAINRGDGGSLHL